MAVKTKDIAKQQGFDEFDFDRFLVNANQKEIKIGGFLENTINENDVPRAIELFKEKLAKEENQKAKKEEERRQKELAEREKQLALSRILVTSGFSFEGYMITEYSDFISGESVIQIPRSDIYHTGSSNDENLAYALSIIRKRVINKLRKAANDLGCNAVIGVDFDYITLEPETVNANGGTVYEPYVICVTASGTAVKIDRSFLCN